LYQSVTEIYRPSYTRDFGKIEAGINPEKSIRISKDTFEFEFEN